MDKLVNNIWLGSAGDAQNIALLLDNGIVNTLNVADDLTLPRYPHYKPWSNKIGLVDGPGNSVRKYRVAATVLNALALEGPVLLHCHEGRSRTAAVATLALAIELQYSTEALTTSYAYVCSIRPLCAKMESGHWSGLRAAYEEHCQGLIL